MIVKEQRWVVEVDREACGALLESSVIGRFGFCTERGAEILPVNYVMDGDAVVFRTASGAKLEGSWRAEVVFEVDAFDVHGESGWSVVVHGIAQEVTGNDRPDLVRRLAALSLVPWVPGERTHVMRLAPMRVTGRRVGHGTPNGSGGGEAM